MQPVRDLNQNRRRIRSCTPPTSSGRFKDLRTQSAPRGTVWHDRWVRQCLRMHFSRLDRDVAVVFRCSDTRTHFGHMRLQHSLFFAGFQALSTVPQTLFGKHGDVSSEHLQMTRLRCRFKFSESRNERDACLKR